MSVFFDWRHVADTLIRFKMTTRKLENCLSKVETLLIFFPALDCCFSVHDGNSRLKLSYWTIVLRGQNIFNIWSYLECSLVEMYSAG